MITWIKIYLFTAKLCWRSIFEINLGDHVIYQCRICSVSNGVSRPLWNLVFLDQNKWIEGVDQNDFKKIKSIRNLIHAVSFTWGFYSGYWFDIWHRDISQMRSWP